MFNVVLTPDESGWIVAEVPELPGCFSQCRTEAEALANIEEAIAAWLWADDEKRRAATPSS
jgi:predicted RNase H-like HicB family nuclease